MLVIIIISSVAFWAKGDFQITIMSGTISIIVILIIIPKLLSRAKKVRVRKLTCKLGYHSTYPERYNLKCKICHRIFEL